MIRVKTLGPYKKLYDLPPGTDFVLCIGGRGSGKTYEVSKFIAYNAAVKKKRCVILRDEKESIKDTILNEIFLRYETANKNGVLDAECEKLKTGIVERATGKDLVYTKGFRSSTNQKTATMKGGSDIDIAVIEEAEDVRDADKFDKFVDSLRKRGCIVIVIMNVPDLGHFLINRYMTAVPTEHDGYFDLQPQDIPGFVCIQTSYKDNKHLQPNVVSRYESYGDPDSHLYNQHHYLTDILGLSSAGRKGQVLRKVKPITLKDYHALPFKEFYGQDFGTASPAGLVGVKFDKNNCWCREINYKPMNTLEIAKLYCSLKLSGGDRIVADCADEKAWKKLKRGWNINELPPEYFSLDEKGNNVCKYPALLSGFHVVPCVKGEDSVRHGIDLMDSMNLFAVTESRNLWGDKGEIANYIYDQDKNGNYTNDPKDDFNHLIDPWRYVVNDQRGKRKFAITTG